MAKLRSSMATIEVYPTLQPEERRRLASAIVYVDGETAPVVPIELCSTGAAAMSADLKCLRSLSENATARVASMVLAGNSTLGA